LCTLEFSMNYSAGMPSACTEKLRIAVVGSGAFGTAMAHVAAQQGDNQHTVTMYARDSSQAAAINSTRRNPKYLSDYELPRNITATSSVSECIFEADIIMLCLPAQKTPDFLREHRDLISPSSVLCCTAKGLYVPTSQLLADAIRDALERESDKLCFLSGPSFAVEIMKNMPTSVVVASKYLYTAVKVQRALSSKTFRVYSSQDMIGVQLGGALKNPLAIGAGLVEGLGYGINTLAAYVTRSCCELQLICAAMGGNENTISGLSGVGDLMLTAFGSLSRNRKFGIRIANGEKLEDILGDYTVEGVPTATVAVKFADDCGLDVPIFRAVESIITGKAKVEDLSDSLMNLPLRMEY